MPGMNNSVTRSIMSEEVNILLQNLADEANEERIAQQYDEFLEEMYYCLECEQWERDMELYDEFG